MYIFFSYCVYLGVYVTDEVTTEVYPDYILKYGFAGVFKDFPYEPLDDKSSTKVNPFENYDNTKNSVGKYRLMGSWFIHALNNCMK